MRDEFASAEFLTSFRFCINMVSLYPEFERRYAMDGIDELSISFCKVNKEVRYTNACELFLTSVCCVRRSYKDEF